MPLATAGFFTPVRVCDKCCVAAKKAHARMVEERQQQWFQQQPPQRRQHRLKRSNHSDDHIVYDGETLFPTQQRAPDSTLTRRGTQKVAPPQSFLRSQTARAFRVQDSVESAVPHNGQPLVTKHFFADPYMCDDGEGDDERDSFERGSRMNQAGTEVAVCTVTGEVVLTRSADVLCRLMHRGEQRKGTLYVTNYRLVFSPYVDDPEDQNNTSNIVAIPIASLERLKRQQTQETDTGVMDIVTKDLRHVQFLVEGLVSKQTFNKFDEAVCTIRQYAFSEPVAIREPFVRASAAATAALISSGTQSSPELDGWKVYDPVAEFARMGVGAGGDAMSPRWRISNVNADYSLCGTYPSLVAVPASVSDNVLAVAAKFRSKARIPVLSWRDTRTDAVISRSSQPLVGLGGRQCDKDVFLIQAIAVANPSSSRLVIIDARPWKNAVAQKTVGRAGYELTEHYETRHAGATTKYADMAASSVDFDAQGVPNSPAANRQDDGEPAYDDDDDAPSAVSDKLLNQLDTTGVDPSLVLTECKLIFMGIENIHTMRKSYNKLLDLCLHKPNDKWLEQLASTRWIEHLSKILDSAVEIVRIVHEQKTSILVHCSDGWDRTPQLTALAQLMLDPYYRTITGFQVLIEKEWCSFGHKFRERTAHFLNPSTSHDMSPVFLQFIDCVWQVYRQFPYAFEFNEQYLMIILDHLYSCRFGTFMYSTEKERRTMEAQGSGTISLWTFIAEIDRSEITNPFFSPPRKLARALMFAARRSNVNPEELSAFLSSPEADDGERTESRPETDDASPVASPLPDQPPSGVAAAPIRVPLPLSLNSPPADDSLRSISWSMASPVDSKPARRVSWCVPAVEGASDLLGRSRTDSVAEEDEDAPSDVLIPCALSRALKFWSRYYLRWDPSTVPHRASSGRIEASHRELQFQLMDAHQQIEHLRGVVADLEHERLASSKIKTHEPVWSPPFSVDLPLSSSTSGDVATQLEILTQRKIEAMARLEQEFTEQAAKILQPALESAAGDCVVETSSSTVAVP